MLFSVYPFHLIRQNFLACLKPSEPRDVTINMLPNESIQLSWKRPFSFCGNLKKYVVCYHNENNQRSKELKNTFESRNPSIVIDELSNVGKHSITVKKI